MKLSIKVVLSQVVILILSLGNMFSQTTIAKQSFESSGDTWLPLSLSTPACTSGADIWDFTTSINAISANDGAQFWGIADLNGNCGGSSFESITLPNVNISSYTSVTFSFDYNAFEFDGGDDLKYELFYDNVSQGEVVVVDGNSNLSTTGWETETVSIPVSVTNVSVILYARQNGGGDYGGFDNVFLEGINACTPAVISNVSPTSGPEGTTVTITASSGDLTGANVSFNGVASSITSSNATTIVCTVPVGATTGDITIIDGQPCSTVFSSFTVTCGATTEPITNSSALNFSDIKCEELTFDWVNGNGTNRIVVMSTSVITGIPTDQTAYTANSVFGSGTTIAASEFVVYNGTGNTVTVTGLTLNTNYFVSIFEYNGTLSNCTENYLTSSPLTGNQMTLSVCATCPYVQSVLVNACGAGSLEGRDEYIIFKNGSSALDINDIKIEYDSQGTFCNTTCGSNTIGNNNTYINSLNATAGCTKFIHMSIIPAGATVIIFTGQTPTYVYDFTTMCGNGEQVIALFCNNSSGAGRFTNGSGTKQTDFTWGTCTQSLFINGSSAGSDGGFANFDASGTISYSNDGGNCLSEALPVKLGYFNAYRSHNSVKLNWETLSEVDANYFELLKSSDGINYEILNEIKASGTSNEIIEYISEDLSPFEGLSYYRLDLINYNGSREVLGNKMIKEYNDEVSVIDFESHWEINHNQTSEGVVYIYNMNGVLLRSVSLTDHSTHLDNSNLPKGVYFIEIKSENRTWVNKIIK